MKPVDGSNILAMRKMIIAQNATLQKATSESISHKGDKQPEFGVALSSAIQHVNGLQHQAGDMTKDYTMGQTTDIASVMLAKQKASVGFEATMQVRNKLLSAYKDIMSMPV